MGNDHVNLTAGAHVQVCHKELLLLNLFLKKYQVLFLNIYDIEFIGEVHINLEFENSTWTEIVQS